MGLGHFRSDVRPAPVAEMNVVPLVDVMLVLLVIFIVTAPLLTHAVKIDLPKAASTANAISPSHVQLAIRANGSLLWDGESVAVDSLPGRFKAAVARAPTMELELRADRNVRYEQIAQVMSMAARAGMRRIGFVTDPATPSGATH